MDLLLADFENLKVSAFTKYSQISGNLNEVTIGPNSVVQKKKQEKSVNHDEADQAKAAPKKTPPKRISNESVNDDVISFRQMLKELELQRQEQVDEAIKNRSKQFTEFLRKQKLEQQDEWLKHQQNILHDMQMKDQSIMQTLHEHDSSKMQNKEKLVKHYQEVIQRRLQYEEQIERAKEKQRECKENIEKLNKFQKEFRQVYQEIIILLKSCSFIDELKKQLGDNFKLLKAIPESMDDLVSKCKIAINDEHLAKAASLVEEVKSFRNQIKTAVDFVHESHEKKKEAQQVAPVAPQPLPTQTVKPAAETVEAPIQLTLTQCISPNNLKRYSEIKQYLEHHSDSFRDLLLADQYKQFRFDCKKAINIPVNAVSAVTSDHLKDKYVRIHNLLAGKNVIVSDKQVNASQHPQGIPFCMDFLARKFVLQGDLMVSSNPDAAFCYATLILTLWNDFPDFGKLLLGYFYKQCPYLIPFHIPKTEGQSEEDYYVSLGYAYNSGQIEKQDKFIKRMTGIMRLYFALFISRPRRGYTNHPHNLSNAWVYLVSILKIEPQMDITATALHTFLDTVGFQMDVAYGNAFRKLLRILNDKFLPVLKKIDSGGPVARLELLLDNYKSEGRFHRPNGILSANFW